MAMGMWERIRQFGGPDIPQAHRHCEVCRRPFLSGAIRLERGHSVGALCHTCLAAAMARDPKQSDLFARPK